MGPGRLGLDPALDAAGIGLAGVLSAADYDARVAPAWQTRALLPGARSAVVLACGGSAFFRACMDGPETAAGRDPLDARLARLMDAAVAHERAAGHAASAGLYFERRAGRYLDLIALAEAAGLGARSRLALLLHPVYGPWMAIRALLLSERPLAPTCPDPDFAPCHGCPAPCAAACPGGAVACGDPAFDAAACFRTSARLEGCRAGCDARRACVVGKAHAYDPDAEAWHRRAALASAPADPAAR